MRREIVESKLATMKTDLSLDMEKLSKEIGRRLVWMWNVNVYLKAFGFLVSFESPFDEKPRYVGLMNLLWLVLTVYVSKAIPLRHYFTLTSINLKLQIVPPNARFSNFC